MTKQTPRFTNRLHLESSPYLLQHAHNPVNWYPWGTEAFETAKKLGRPIFLSIGYSTCHWCHVMEHESFEDLEIAEYLNANYISVKVDREERPDIDAIYMSAVQAVTGRGGWPMSVWLTDDKKPFYAGTYFPPRAGARGASFGFLEVIKHLRGMFGQNPSDVAYRATEISKVVKANLEPRSEPGQLSHNVIENAVAYYASRFDEDFGGMRGQPKFPSSFPIRTLLRAHATKPSPDLLSMITKTLRSMARGGIYDQVAGGFHRYSVDAEWLVPHFEKMLYDNALLARAYIEGFQATGDGEFSRVAHELFAYIEREMTSPEGVFYSATDADSMGPSGHMEEGYFFTWTLDELRALLTPSEFQLATTHYQVTASGNFEGRNILSVDRNAPALHDQSQLNSIKQKLYDARRKRPLPLRDEKILTSWNALMISALAKGAVALDEPRYLERAVRAATFICDHMHVDGQLYRVFKDSKAKQPAFLDDYAFLIAAFLDLYEASGDMLWLSKAMDFESTLHADFEDTNHGGYFMSGSNHEELIAREKPAYDGAEPSGNSVQCLNLFRLYHLTMQEIYRERGEKCLAAFSSTLERNATSLSEMLIALSFSKSRRQEVILIAKSKDEAKPFVDILHTRFAPHAYMLVLTQVEARAQEHVVPALQGKIAIDGKATAYICEGGVCQLPVTDQKRLHGSSFAPIQK